MFRICLVGEESEKTRKLHSELTRSGFTCVVASNRDDIFKQVSEQPPDLVLVTINGHTNNSGILELSHKIKQDWHLPIVALVNKDTLATSDIDKDIDDFVVEPHDVNELTLRAKRLLQRVKGTDTSDVIKCGDLNMDPAQYEVTLKGSSVELTFKEYELLKFLASHRGRVFTRDALLNQIWGYDYFGGDRTVDVHIRRLRSKLEAHSNQPYIETVRNIGYRFNPDI